MKRCFTGFLWCLSHVHVSLLLRHCAPTSSRHALMPGSNSFFWPPPLDLSLLSSLKPQRRHVASRCIFLSLRPHCCATNDMCFLKVTHKHLHFCVRNIHSGCCLDSPERTIDSRPVSLHQRSWWALHWLFMVEWGHVQGCIWGWSTCAYFQVDCDG